MQRLRFVLFSARLSPLPRRTLGRDLHHRSLSPHVLTLIVSEPEVLIPGDGFIMAYVITDTCIKDSLCVDVCPTDCIHPKKDEPDFEAATQMYVEPDGCIDCGACVPVCTSDSIHALDDVPDEKKEFIERNAVYYKK
jgi:ferredoxin